MAKNSTPKRRSHFTESLLDVYPFRALEDFLVDSYLALRINIATKPGRSPKDVARFAVAVYHGMYPMVSSAQRSVSNIIEWSPVEAELIKRGYQDEVNYINEIVQ